MAKRARRPKSKRTKRINKKRSKGGLKKLVRREIARNVENKSKQSNLITKALYGSASTSFQDNIVELGPGVDLVVTQGVGAGNRVGNRIKTKKLTWKGTMVPLPYNAVNNSVPVPIQIKIWIFYDRTDPTAEPQPTTNFFQDGSSSRGFLNDLVDMWSPINTDRYRILASKTFKLGYANYAGTHAGTGTEAQQFFANNDFKYNANFSFNLTKHYPKNVRFDDNNGIPTSRGLYALFQPVAADGSALPASSVPVGVQFMMDYVYEDA